MIVFYKTSLTRRNPSRSVKYIIAKWRNSKQTLYPNKESKRQITLYQRNQIPYALTNAMLIGIDRASKPQTISRLWVNTWKAKSSFEPDEENPCRKERKKIFKIFITDSGKLGNSRLPPAESKLDQGQSSGPENSRHHPPPPPYKTFSIPLSPPKFSRLWLLGKKRSVSYFASNVFLGRTAAISSMPICMA